MVLNTFIELAIIIFIAVIMSALMRFLKQPLIMGYILTGIASSPYFLNIVTSSDAISTFAEIGVVFLMFTVGLSLNPKSIKDVGKISLLAGLGQVVFMSLFGFIILRWFGFSIIESVYIGVALAFSSTIIIMKLMSDKGILQTLYGRITIGFLIVQDLIVILVIMIISSMSKTSGTASLILESLLKGIGLLLLLFLAGIYIVPKIISFVAKSQEFLLLFSIGWCFFIAAIFYYFNFSMEAGALLAGITLSTSTKHFEITSKMKPLRDFFLIIFFILLGSQMTFENIIVNIIPIVALSLFVLIGTPIITLLIMGWLGYTKRTGFFVGTAVAQISEFSLILITIGIQSGNIPSSILSLVTVVAIITIAGSTYFIQYSEQLYKAVAPFIKIFERKGLKVGEQGHYAKKYDIILFGCNRIGRDLADTLLKMKKKFLIVDYDPDIVSRIAAEGFECRYGDASDIEMIMELPLSTAKMVISTVPDIEVNLFLIRKMQESNKKAVVVVVSHNIDEAMKLYDAGATYVILPHFLGSHRASTMIEEYGLSLNKFLKEKIMHINSLKHKKSLGHEHPLRET